MNSYPETLLCHLQPLLFVAGLGTGQTYAAARYDETFHELVSDLRRACIARSKIAIWDPSRGNSAEFHIVLVDDGQLRFPPRKAKSSAPGPTHSPISPLTPDSPLYPDGLIAPIWIRKHRDMLPACFVLVLTLSGTTAATQGPLATSDDTYSEQERVQDAQLVQQIVERKRQVSERGIKLAVVLLASTDLLQSSTLDYRLSIIRRQSGLDSRASLFVISPVTGQEVAHFVASLQRELFDAAVDYYKDHGRRTRRKKSKVPSSVPRQAITASPVLGNALATFTTPGTPAPSPQGWSCRYDYKMACFAEWRAELQVALKHYEDCYHGLIDMFSSPVLLGPRTKRWLEAKVLADCVNAKICKLYLYADEGSRAVAQLNTHLNRFRTLCEGWGIGTDTFEFWSWASKQYRLFGDLLEIAHRSGYKVPTLHKPAVIAVPSNNKADPQSALAVNPANALQHSAHYYYLAALCAIQRKKAYEHMASLDADSEAGADSDKISKAALDHERAVNHHKQILELLTRSYEIYKRHEYARTALVAVSLIAEAHTFADNPAAAFQFYERIADTYRSERWSLLWNAANLAKFQSARTCNDPIATFKATLELLGTSQSPVKTLDDAAAPLLTQPVPQGADATIRINVDQLGSDLISFRSSFATSTSDLEHAVSFGILARVLQATKLLVWTSWVVQFTDDPTLKLVHAAEEESQEESALGEMTLDGEQTQQERSANLANLINGQAQKCVGTIRVNKTHTAEISKMTLSATVGDWTLEFYGVPKSDIFSCRFLPRPVLAQLEVQREEVAFLDEQFPIDVVLTNQDNVAFEASLHISVKPSSRPTETTTISIQEQSSTSSIHLDSIGQLEPQQSLTLRVLLKCSGDMNNRLINLSLKCRPVTSKDAEPFNTPCSECDLSENVVVPVSHAISCQVEPKFRARRRHNVIQSALKPPVTCLDAVDMELEAHLSVVGPDSMTVHDIQLLLPDDNYLFLNQSLLSEKDLPLVLTKGQTYSLLWLLDLLRVDPQAVTHASVQLVWSRQGSQLLCTTQIPLPTFHPPDNLVEPMVVASYPPVAVLRHPVTFEYVVSNTSSTRPLYASFQVDSLPDWVMSSPRKLTKVTILPASEHVVRISAVPIGKTGQDMDVPRLRCWLVEDVLPPPKGPQAPSRQGTPQPTSGTTSRGTSPFPEPDLSRSQELPVLAEGTEIQEDLQVLEKGQAVRRAKIMIVPG